MASTPGTPIPLANTGNSALNNVLNLIQEATIIAGLVAPLTGPLAGEVAAGSQIAMGLESIITNAVAAHQAALGSPIDITKLVLITPLS